MAGRDADFGQPIPGYRILERIGSGGTSSVYRAKQLSLGREVAIKVVRGERTERETRLARMEKEARVLARLNHPNIVRSIDFGEAGELVYFTMEFIEGRSAKELIEDEGPMSARDALVLAECVAEALGAATAHGVVHRDVKPGNILLGVDGSVKLSDFGLARTQFDRSLTRDGATVGTPQYMAPEQVRSARTVDVRSDFYGLGATLYHLVTGEPPFRGDSVAEILHEVLFGRPTPPEQIVPDVHPALSRVIARLMARNPSRRYADAASLVCDLQRVRALIEAGTEDDDAPIGLSWQAAAEAPWRWRSMTTMALGAGALLLLGAALALVIGGPGGGEDAEVKDPSDREAEIAALEASFRSLEVEPFDVLRVLAESTNGQPPGVAEARLRDEALKGARAELGAMAHAVWGETERRLERGPGDDSARWLGDAATLREAFDDALDRRGIDPAGPASRAGFDLDTERRRQLAPHIETLEQLRRALDETWRTSVMDAVSRALEDATSAVQSSSETPIDVEEVVDGLAQTLDRARLDHVREVFARHDLTLRDDVTAEQLRDGWPAAWRDDTDALLLGLENALGREIDRLRVMARAEVRDALSRLREKVGAIAPTDADLLESASSRWGPWLEAFPHPAVARLHPDEAATVEEELSAVRGALDERLYTARSERREQERDRLLAGPDGSSSALDFLAARQPEQAVELLAAADPAWRSAELDAWQGVSAALAEQLAGFERAWAKRDGETVELRQRNGIKLTGALRYGGPESSFRIGRSELTRADLPWSFIREQVGGTLDARADAVARVLWDEPRGDEVFGALPEGPIRAFVDAQMESRRLAAEGRSRTLEDEAQALWEAISDAMLRRDFEEARARLEALRRVRFARTSVYRTHRSELAELETAIEFGAVRAARWDAMRPRYARASTFTLDDGSGRLVLEYDFSRDDQALDWARVGGEVVVANRKMRFENHDSDSAVGRGLAGPQLDLPIDHVRPYTCTLDLEVPQEQREPPHFIGLDIGGVCVGFFRPTSPRGESLDPQFQAWCGSLDDFSEHFFYPFDPTLEGPDRPPLAYGLERGARLSIEVRRTEDGEIEIRAGQTLLQTLDAADAQRAGGRRLTIHAKAAQLKPRWADDVSRAPSRLHIDRVRFEGWLRR